MQFATKCWKDHQCVCFDVYCRLPANIDFQQLARETVCCLSAKHVMYIHIYACVITPTETTCLTQRIQIHISSLSLRWKNSASASREGKKQTRRSSRQKRFLTRAASRHFFGRRTLPRAETEMVQLFPIQRLCFSKNRSRDVKMAHVGAYRSCAHMGLAACLENLWSKPPLLRTALLDFTPSP